MNRPVLFALSAGVPWVAGEYHSSALDNRVARVAEEVMVGAPGECVLFPLRPGEMQG